MQSRVFFCLSLVLVVGCLACSGCLAPPAGEPPQSPTQTTLPVTIPTTEVPVVESTPPTPAPTAIGLSSEDINLHFIDVAFGRGNIYLERLPLSSKRTTISMSAGTDTDRQVVESFAVKFNTLSQSNKLFENTKEGQTGDIRIKFLSPDGLKAIDLTSEMGWLNREFTCNGIACAKVKGYDIYLNADMKGDQRSHYLLRALLYTLGFKGDTLRYTDSLFSYPENMVTELSFLDEKALQVMYGLGMDNGMTVDDVKRVLFFR